MKKLTQKQQAAVRKIVMNKDGRTVNRVNGMESLKSAVAILNGERVHMRHQINNGRKTKIETTASSFNAMLIVEAMGYKVRYGNDAPRGGQLGQYVEKEGNRVRASVDQIIEAVSL